MHSANSAFPGSALITGFSRQIRLHGHSVLVMPPASQNAWSRGFRLLTEVANVFLTDKLAYACQTLPKVSRSGANYANFVLPGMWSENGATCESWETFCSKNGKGGRRATSVARGVSCWDSWH